jgi:uncharacterized protein (DUF697 family)
MSDNDRRKKQLNEIIKNFSTAAATSSAAFAIVGILGIDSTYALRIHIGMVQEIGKIFGYDISKEKATSILEIAMGDIGKGIVGTAALSWLPIAGSIFNAATTFNYTQALGRWIYSYFLNNLDSLSREVPNKH